MTTHDGTGTVEIYPLRYTVADLRTVPEEEAVFFLMCGQLQNDIVILMRQLLQATNALGDAEPLRLAATTAAMLNSRTLAARLAEGWKLIKDRFQLAFKTYAADIKDDAKADMAWLRPYFSKKGCLVRDIRDKAVSHFDLEVAVAGYRKLSDTEPLIDLHAMMEGNTIYFSGEVLMLSALHHLTGAQTAPEALEKIGDEILEVARRMGNVIRAYLQAFSERHFARQLSRLNSERMVVSGQPRVTSFAAPIYLAGPRALSETARRLLAGVSPLALRHFGRT